MTLHFPQLLCRVSSDTRIPVNEGIYNLLKLIVVIVLVGRELVNSFVFGQYQTLYTNSLFNHIYNKNKHKRFHLKRLTTVEI